MDYSFRERAKKSLEELEEAEAKILLEKVDELADEGLGHGNVKLIQDRNGEWLYRLKVTESGLNYRVFLDYVDGKIKILDVIHREDAYEGEYGNRT